MRVIDRFSLKHRRFGIPKLMLYIIIGTAVVYLFGMMDSSGKFIDAISFYPPLILRGQIWRLVTWIFYPTASNIIFLAIMLYFYYFIGSTLEREWGTPKFTIYYLLGILTHVVFAFIVWVVSGATVFIDASYLNLSMFFAFAVFYPDQRVMLFFFIPIKIKWLALVDAAFFVFAIISSIISGSYFYIIVPIAAVLNFFVFCTDDLMRYLRPYKARTSGQAINFRRAARKYKNEQESKPFRHKCSVCGKTDTEYPELEFRYCSKCNGYHCFCIDHINNHVHFQ